MNNTEICLLNIPKRLHFKPLHNSIDIAVLNELLFCIGFQIHPTCKAHTNTVWVIPDGIVGYVDLIR